MADLNDLAIFMDNLNGRIVQGASDASRQIATAVLDALVRATPADTGTAMSNWLVSAGAPNFQVIPAYVPSPKGKVRKGIWIHIVDPLVTQQANLQFVLDKGNVVIGAKQPGEDIFITNNVEYIEELNSGTSDQAPAGFVDIALLVAGKVVGSVTII